MGIVDGILQAGVGAVGGAIGNLAKDIRTAITGKEAITAAEREQVLAATSQMEQLALQADRDIATGQMKINEIETGSNDKFKSRWRPLFGYVCVAGYAYHFLLRPLFPWFATVLLNILHAFFKFQNIDIPALPNIDTGPLFTALMGILGLGGMRTWEKFKGTV
jgi:hypothetical protein